MSEASKRPSPVELLAEAIETISVRLNAQEAIMVAVAEKLKITKEDAFSALDLIELSESAEYLPQIRHAILSTLNHRR